MKLNDFAPVMGLSRASTLPARWYVEPEFLELEKDKIFWRTWQPVGHLDMVLRPGDYFAAEVLGEPVVVTRGLDGTLRAFSNVCRHRAGTLAVGMGNRKSLQCRYHGWTYGLDGRLLSQPEFEGVNDWHKNEICLPSVKVDAGGPFVFVNLDPHSPALCEVLGNIPNEVEQSGFDLKNMRSVERRDYIVNCNWKVYVDNYLEGYHVPIAHPGLFRELDYEQYRVDTCRYYSSQYAPIRPARAGEIQGRDRRYIRTEAESQALYYWIFPNFMVNLYPKTCTIIMHLVLPVSNSLIKSLAPQKKCASFSNPLS